jgi:signal peptidase II
MAEEAEAPRPERADAQRAEPSGVPRAEHADPPRARRALALYGTAAAVLAVDQLLKHLVVSNLAGRPPVKVIGSFVELRYTTNSGGAFSLLTGAPLFFGVMAIAIIGGIVYASRRTEPLSMLLVLGLVLGGALGNLTDRLFRGDELLRGEVVDFVKVGIWPVFNLADSCIVVGGLLLAIFLGRADRTEREQGRGPADAP